MSDASPLPTTRESRRCTAPGRTLVFADLSREVASDHDALVSVFLALFARSGADEYGFYLLPTDPLTITATTLLLAAAALGAALVPAYRASMVNPTDALRAE